MIDAQGISTGEEVRRILEQMESGLIVNYKNFFDAKKDKPINQVDLDKWQRQQLSKFPTFQRRNQSIIKSYVKPLNKAILDDLKASYQFGINYVTKQVSNAKKKGKPLQKVGYSISSFGKNRRVQNQIKDIQRKLNNAFHNALKDLDKQYLETVSKAKTLASVSPTLHSAIDLAGKGLLVGGITAGLTASGRRMNIVNRLELQTVEGSQEIMFIGEGEKASEVGNYLVYITIHASACPLCTPWQNKVLIDDVYQNGKPDGKHELLSVAIKQGLMHYNCRHNRLTFIEGIDKIPDVPGYVPHIDTGKRKHANIGKQHRIYKKEQLQRKMERQIRMWKRRELGSLSEQEYRKSRLKVRQWQSRRNHLVKSTDGLYRSQYWREKPGFRLVKDKRWRDLKYNKNIV